MCRLSLSLLTILLVLGCGGSEPAKAVTLEEYAQTICPLDENQTDDQTWGKFKASMEEIIEVYESVEPPASILRYHQARLAGAKAVLAVVETKDQSAQANLFEFLGESTVLASAMAIGTVEDELTGHTRAVLIDWHCIDN